ncbi:MAG: NADH-quinone oxidoreductase subunit D [Actinobacteria bacterium]|nr:NADH-quinone oxidoreductase subunit D [Actinomycetota bacterium]
MINMGPQHPSTHGVFKLVLKLDGETVIDAEPEIGYLHRSVEKIAENRTYEQVLPLTDRLDYVNAMGNNLAYVMAVENAAGIEVPERAKAIRVIMAEFNRIASHLISLGTQGLEVGSHTLFLYCFREREKILDLFEKASGGRLTYSYFRFGGISKDLPKGWIDEAREFLNDFENKMEEYFVLLLDNPIYKGRTVGIGIIKPETAISYGASGPVIRGSGIPYDVRKANPYLIYNKLDFNIPTGENGDVWDRAYVRFQEMKESVKIIRQVIENLPEGSVLEREARYIVIEEGLSSYFSVESPRGELGFFIYSDGTEKPYRLKIRSPAFVNLSMIKEIIKGEKLADVPLVLGSLDPVFGEVDR